jgi:hypothetical protein
MFNFFSNKKLLNAKSDKLYEYILNSSLLFATLVTSKFKAEYTDKEFKEFLATYDDKGEEGTYGEYVLFNEIAFESTILLLHILDRAYLQKVNKKNADYLFDNLTEKLFNQFAKRLSPAYEANEKQIYNMLINRDNQRVDDYFSRTVGVKDMVDMVVTYGELLATQVKKAEQYKVVTYGTKVDENQFENNWLIDLDRVKSHATKTQLEGMSFFYTYLKNSKNEVII